MYILFNIFYFEKKIISWNEQFFFKKWQAHCCILLILLCSEHVQVKFWGILWERSGYLRKVWEVENGDICRTCVGLCWSDHPYTVAFIYLFSQWVMSVSSNGHSIEQIRTEMRQNSLHVNRLRIMFWIWSNLTTF